MRVSTITNNRDVWVHASCHGNGDLRANFEINQHYTRRLENTYTGFLVKLGYNTKITRLGNNLGYGWTGGIIFWCLICGRVSSELCDN